MDRIGAGAFFWSFPSKGLCVRQQEIKSLTQRIEDTKESIEDTGSKLIQEKENRTDPDNLREDKLARIEKLKAQISSSNKKLEEIARSDPKKVEELTANTKIAFEAGCRWTDNLYEVKSWIQKKTMMENSEIQRNFPIFKDLDHPE